MAELDCVDDHFVVYLDEGQDWDRALRILRAACLVIDDRVAPLYAGQTMPERTSELELANYH